MLSYFLTVHTPGSKSEKAAALLKFFRQNYLPLVQEIPDIVAIRAFVPSPEKAPFFDDEDVPDLSLQLLLASPNGLTTALAKGELADFREIPNFECTVTHQLFELIEQPLPNNHGLAYGKATQSFAVRYYSFDSFENEDGFRKAYLKGHPVALANFPAVRRIFCYIPFVWNDPSNIENANAIIGNEVVFESISDLRTAFLSPAMAIAGRHFRTLPRFRGWNTHFPISLVHEWTATNITSV
jgi:hypothetical protein